MVKLAKMNAIKIYKTVGKKPYSVERHEEEARAKLAEIEVEEKQKKAEGEEKERFLNLSDREKRALAAERRLLGSDSLGVNSLQRQRCFSCGLDITGKTPFQYSENKFCSVGCVKKHRQQNN